MRFRPANISLINRRHYLPRLLLTVSSFEKNDQRTLTGHYISISGLAVIHSEGDFYGVDLGTRGGSVFELREGTT